MFFGGYGFAVFEMMFSVVFILVIGMFIAAAVKGIGEWGKNNASPRLTVTAEVVTKRTSISHHRHTNAGDVTGAHGYHTSTSTSYYVTFQVESGDRMEFSVNGREYGMLAEGDKGKLSLQGTRYLGFERKEQTSEVAER